MARWMMRRPFENGVSDEPRTKCAETLDSDNLIIFKKIKWVFWEHFGALLSEKMMNVVVNDRRYNNKRIEAVF